MAEYSKYSWTLDGDKMFVSNYHSYLLCRCWEWGKSHNHHFSQESKSLAAKVFQWNKKWMSPYLFQSEEHVCNCTFSKGSQYFSSIALNKHSRELKKTLCFIPQFQQESYNHSSPFRNPLSSLKFFCSYIPLWPQTIIVLTVMDQCQ